MPFAALLDKVDIMEQTTAATFHRARPVLVWCVPTEP